jgi:hypothetical protein
MSFLQEHRAATRRRVLYGAEIVTDSDCAECTIRNLSANGAGLRLSGPAPAAFQLRIVRDNSVCPARIVWRHGDDCGVTFVGDAPEATNVVSIKDLCSTLQLSRIDRTNH